MLLLSKSDIKKVFSMKDAIEADKLAFQMLEEGNCEVPLRVQIQAKDDKGTFLFMPAYSGALGAAGLKVVNVFPDNTEKGHRPTEVAGQNLHLLHERCQENSLLC